jgi:hypothetical protein
MLTLPPPPPKAAVVGRAPLPIDECDSELAAFRDGPPLPCIDPLPPPLLPPSRCALRRSSACKMFDGQFSDADDDDSD